MSEIVEDLEDKLKELTLKKKKRLIRGVYNQLVPGQRSKERQPGEYRDLVEKGSEIPLGLIAFVYERLREYNMPYRAKRLKNSYPLTDDWLKDINRG